MRRVENERGAVAIIVAIMMVALLGFAAIGVDVANIASDKQQLQNGADAGALAVAQSCAQGSCGNATGTATTVAAANRNDGAATAAIVTPSLSPASGEVTVQTTGVTNHWFAPVLGTAASTITAIATAVWEPPSGAATFPLTISYCDLTKQSGVAVQEDGSVTIGSTSTIMTFYMTGKGQENNNGCALSTGSSGSIPGGFGHLDANPGETAGSCYAETTASGGTIGVGSDPGNGPDPSCTNAWFKTLLGTPVLVPVFNAVQGQGQNATYTIYGYAAIILYGYNLNPGKYSEYIAPLAKAPCKGDDRCIAGKFVTWVFPEDLASAGGPAPDLGATVVRLSH